MRKLSDDAVMLAECYDRLSPVVQLVILRIALESLKVTPQKQTLKRKDSRSNLTLVKTR